MRSWPRDLPRRDSAWERAQICEWRGGDRYAGRLKRSDCVVVGGDASSIEGSAAPCDEEETKQVVHVEKLNVGLDLLECWLKNQNSDQVSARRAEPRIFSN